MTKKLTYKHTVYACYIGYIVQAIVNNFAPLLFLTFHNSYHIPIEQIGLLVTINFVTQLSIDLLAARFADRIGYRCCIMAAHCFAAAGLIGLSFLPDLFADPFAGLVIAVVLYAVGGGLLEVLVSPIVEAVPADNKASLMSLLHSFYCWGAVGVIALSSLFFAVFGIENWRYVACGWAVIPILNFFYYSKVPIVSLNEEGKGMSIRELLRTRLFWILVLLMLGAGASELAMSQWSSAFAESGLKVSKTVGDLAGPCLFAILMGSARVFHSRKAERIDLNKYMAVCCGLCIVSYAVASLSPWPVLSLLACGLCGISVACMWPGTFSLASRVLPTGGTSMFALLALAGDAGCSMGPASVGFLAAALGDDLKRALLIGAVFPFLMLLCLLLSERKKKKAVLSHRDPV